MADNILLKYYTYLKFERNFTDNSVSAYMSDINKLQKFALAKGKTLISLEQLDIEEFITGLNDIGIEATSQKRILVGTRSFYKFLRLEKITQNDPTEFIESPKLGEQLPVILSVDEIDRMINATDPSTCDGQRNRAIIETLYSCGLRVSELTELRVSNIYEEEGYVSVFGKGRKQRIVPIAESAIREIKNYFNFRYEIDGKHGF